MVFRLGLGGGIGPTNQPKQVFMIHCCEPPFPFPVSFSATNSSGHRRPRPGPLPNTTFTSSVYCREAVNTTRRLLCIVCRFFSDISKTTFNPLYCAKVRHNFPTRGADINQLEGVQRLETRLMIGRRHMPYEGGGGGFAISTSSRWNADTSALTSSRPSKVSKVKLISSPTHPRHHLQITVRTKASSSKGRCIFCASRQMTLFNDGPEFRIETVVKLWSSPDAASTS